MELNLWPWDKENAKPYFINEEGIEWWIEKDLTEWATRDDLSSKPLKAICFITRKEGKTLDRILVGENQKILAIDSSLEGMSYKIDILRIQFDE